MKKIIALISSIIIIIGATCCFAELYEYEDSNGVLHFTDDPSKVPPRTTQSKKKQKPSLTVREQRMVEFLNTSGREVEIPAKDLDKSKKQLNEFYEINKEHLSDIDQGLESRLSTPEGAFNTFIMALQNGNKQDLRASVTLSFWQDGDFETANKSQFIELGNKMASCTKRIISRDEKSATIELKENSNSPNRMEWRIKLVNLRGNWKLNRL